MEKLNTYRPAYRRQACLPAGEFADYKVKVIDLLERLTMVSVVSIESVSGMEKALRN